MTYEVGRLEDEPGLKLLGAPQAEKLAALAEELQAVGQKLKQFASGESNEENETDVVPQASTKLKSP